MSSQKGWKSPREKTREPQKAAELAGALGSVGAGLGAKSLRFEIIGSEEEAVSHPPNPPTPKGTSPGRAETC